MCYKKQSGIQWANPTNTKCFTLYKIVTLKQVWMRHSLLEHSKNSWRPNSGPHTKVGLLFNHKALWNVSLKWVLCQLPIKFEALASNCPHNTEWPSARLPDLVGKKLEWPMIMFALVVKLERKDFKMVTLCITKITEEESITLSFGFYSA